MITTSLALLLSAAPSVADGQALLEAAVAAEAETTALTASYVQQRTTPLMTKPLESEGTLTYRSAGPEQNGVLRLETPRSVIRVGPEQYEVWRKTAKVVEYAKVPSEGWATVLFDVVGLEARALERLRVVGYDVEDGGRTLRLEPTSEADAERVKKITLSFASAVPELRSLAFTTSRGDTVRFVLDGLERNPELGADAFELGAPEGTKRVPLPTKK